MEMLKLGKVTRVATEVITYGKTEITSNLYIKNIKKLCFSSKQGFEEKSITEHVIIEIIVAETLFDLLLCLLTIIEH